MSGERELSGESGLVEDERAGRELWRRTDVGEVEIEKVLDTSVGRAKPVLQKPGDFPVTRKDGGREFVPDCTLGVVNRRAVE